MPNRERLSKEKGILQILDQGQDLKVVVENQSYRFSGCSSLFTSFHAAKARQEYPKKVSKAWK